MGNQKVFKGENLQEGMSQIVCDKPLIQVEFLKTEDGLGCVVSANGAIEELCKYAGKSFEEVTDELEKELMPVVKSVSSLIARLERDIYCNAFGALKEKYGEPCSKEEPAYA